MKRFMSIAMACAMLAAGSVTAFAQAPDTTPAIPTELAAVVADMEENARLEVIHDDGSKTIVKPNFELKKVNTNSRSSEETYELTASATYALKGKTGSTSSKKGDATIVGTIYYTTSGTRIVADEVSVSFRTQAPGTVFSKRTVTLGGNGSGPKYSNVPMTFNKSSIGYVCSTVNRPRMAVTANVEGNQFTDRLTLTVKV